MGIAKAFGPKDETEKFKSPWLQWGASLSGGATFFSVAQWRASYRNGFLQHCEWVDYTAIVFGGVAVVLILIFWAKNTETAGHFFGKLFRCGVAATAMTMFLYGFGIGGDGPCPPYKQQQQFRAPHILPMPFGNN